MRYAVLVVLGLAFMPPVLARDADQLYRTELGAPFDGWHVTVTPDSAKPDLLKVEFDSKAVHQRTTTLVWLPSRYRDSKDLFPVAYFLHGQIDTATGGAGPAAYDAGVPLPFPFAPGGSQSFGGTDPEGTADARDFLMVGIDAGQRAWCGHCWYTNGVNGQGVDAERHLLDEVVRLVEQLFRVRTDRGGRAILGNSMGANGSLLVGFRHPDRFAFIGGLSPTYAGFQEKAAFDFWADFIWSQYTVDQGFGPAPVEEVRYDALDPLSLSSHLAGAGTEVMVANGDGCLPNDGRGVCEKEPAYGDPDQELGFRKAMDMWTSQLTERGVRFTNIQREGAHDGFLNADNFRRYFMPRMNQIFARAVAAPATFSYKSIDPTFDIWGWSLSVNRPNLEYLHLLGTATDGSDITLAGTGTARVTTPVIGPGRYRVEVTPDGGDTVESIVAADGSGRVSFTVVLGPTHDVNQTRLLVETGQFGAPHTHVAITPITGAT